MKIAHVCPFVGEQLGGSERYVFNLSKMQSSKFDVHIYTTTRYRKRAGTYRSNGVTIHRFYSPLVIWNVNPLSFMLSGLISADVELFHIHSHLYTLSNQAMIAKILTGKKTLLQLHGGVGHIPYKTNWIKKTSKLVYDQTLGRLTITASDLIASVSRADLELIESEFSIPPARLRYLPNAVDTTIFTPTNSINTSKEFVLLYVGDLEPWKGIGLIVDWIREQRDLKGHTITLRFVGQGSLEEKLRILEDKCKRRNGPIQIELLGQRQHSEIPDLMRNSDALILSSYWEGMPTVILEAMASGIPVISTPVGDIPKAIRDMETGFLINRDVDSLHRAILTLLEEKSQVRQMTIAARKLVEKEFSVKKVEQLVNQMYRELLL